MLKEFLILIKKAGKGIRNTANQNNTNAKEQIKKYGK